MTITRFTHTMTLLPNGKILIAGGESDLSDDILSSAELYDPAAGTWIATSPMNHARGSQTATLLPNGKLLVAGGADGTGRLSSAELFDPVTGTWTGTRPLNHARGGHTATLLGNGLVLVEGGIDSTSADSASAEIYDPNTGTWTYTGWLHQGRIGQTATLLMNGNVLVAGGSSGSTGLSSAEVYDPITGTWTMTGALNAIHFGHTASLLPDGKVLVAGGYAYGNGPSTPISELYDPATGIWTLTGALNYGRIDHIAILLLNGKVLAAGGSSHDLNKPDLGWLTPTELYDPATGTWMPTSGLNTGRAYFAGTLLSNGAVLVAGGDNGSGVISSAELFTSEFVDTTPPTIHCPDNIAIGCSIDPLVPVSFTVTATDNLDPSPTIISTPAAGSGFPVGMTVVNSTARDSSGNESSCSFTITRNALGFTGFLSPIGGADATGGSFANPLQAFKMGSTVPVKFTGSCGGSPVVTGIHTLHAVKYSDSTTAASAIDATPTDAATTGDQFRLNASQWQFNLDTKATGMSVGVWQLIATLSDGSQHIAWIQIK